MQLNLDFVLKSVPEFNGDKGKFNEFIYFMKEMGEMYTRPEDQSMLLLILKSKLTGRAFEVQKHKKLKNWGELKILLEGYFLEKKSPVQMQNDFGNKNPNNFRQRGNNFENNRKLNFNIQNQRVNFNQTHNFDSNSCNFYNRGYYQNQRRNFYSSEKENYFSNQRDNQLINAENKNDSVKNDIIEELSEIINEETVEFKNRIDGKINELNQNNINCLINGLDSVAGLKIESLQLIQKELKIDNENLEINSDNEINESNVEKNLIINIINGDKIEQNEQATRIEKVANIAEGVGFKNKTDKEINGLKMGDKTDDLNNGLDSFANLKVENNLIILKERNELNNDKIGEQIKIETTDIKNKYINEIDDKNETESENKINKSPKKQKRVDLNIKNLEKNKLRDLNNGLDSFANLKVEDNLIILKERNELNDKMKIGIRIKDKTSKLKRKQIKNNNTNEIIDDKSQSKSENKIINKSSKKQKSVDLNIKNLGKNKLRDKGIQTEKKERKQNIIKIIQVERMVAPEKVNVKNMSRFKYNKTKFRQNSKVWGILEKNKGHRPKSYQTLIRVKMKHKFNGEILEKSRYKGINKYKMKKKCVK